MDEIYEIYVKYVTRSMKSRDREHDIKAEKQQNEDIEEDDIEEDDIETEKW